MTPKTYAGSCHCGAVAFEAEIDFSAGTYRCNCSICAKTRYWGVTIKPGAFRLLQGEDALTDYRINTRRMALLFCRHCGVASFNRGDVPESGGAFVSVNVAALDGVEAGVLAALPVTYLDGLHDDWESPPQITAHL